MLSRGISALGGNAFPMTYHSHVQHSGVELLNAAKTALLKAGEQWTAMRSAVFEALSQFNTPASAYDIADIVSKSQGRRIAANSIYRILDIFVSANLAHRVESANAYIVNAHPECRHDCIFLVCDQCNRVIHIDNDKISTSLHEIVTKNNFKVERSVIEIRGQCADCSVV